ncbi:MAG TPA: flagellar basal body rod protein FlgB [Telluria sp.]|nr:flagellar basal body rod protein FlgB [Telluria sp.]
MVSKLDDYLRFNEAALSLRSQRQQVLASNIANADTPNYKARDIDFASALASAVSKAPGASTGALATTSPQHQQAVASGNALADGTPLLYRQNAQGSADNNTVDMDVERNQFADNGVRYEASITMINHQIRNLMAALQGGQ